MKRISILMIVWVLCAAPAMRAQDAATEERLNKLSGQIDDLIAGQKTLRDQLAELSRELQSLRDEQGKPNTSYANHEELSRLADAIKEVDRKRLDDNEKIHADLLKLGNTLAVPAPSHRKSHDAPPTDNPVPDKTATSDKGFEHVIQPGDTLSVIVQGCRDKNIKVTIDQILKANPGLKPEKLHPGQKIFIPAPAS
jgi:LysM repeat protein